MYGQQTAEGAVGTLAGSAKLQRTEGKATHCALKKPGSEAEGGRRKQGGTWGTPSLTKVNPSPKEGTLTCAAAPSLPTRT